MIYVKFIALFLTKNVWFEKKIHTHPMEGHWKFLGGGGVLKAKFFEEMYENKLEFPGGRGGAKQKNLLWGEYGYYLELHNEALFIYCTKQ